MNKGLYDDNNEIKVNVDTNENPQTHIDHKEDQENAVVSRFGYGDRGKHFNTQQELHVRPMASKAT